MSLRLAVLTACIVAVTAQFVVNTWPFTDATDVRNVFFKTVLRPLCPYVLFRIVLNLPDGSLVPPRVVESCAGSVVGVDICGAITAGP